MAAQNGSVPDININDQLAVVVASLKSAITAHWYSCGRVERCSDDRNPIRELFQDENNECEALLESLFVAAEAAERHRPELVMPRQATIPRKFRRRIIGEAPNLSRSKILATMLQIEPAFLLRVWDRLLVHLDDEAFTDSRLPDYTLADLERLLGSSDSAATFSRHQHLFCEMDTTNHFPEVSEKLKALLNESSDDPSVETLVVCRRLSFEGELEGEKTEDHWYPDLVPMRMVENHAALVQTLFVEAYKIVRRIEHETDAQEQRRILSEAKSHAASMYRAVRPRAKVLAILLCSNVTASSSMWRNFVRICLEDSLDNPTLCDSMLPLEEESIRKHLGANDNQLFFSTQYSFCTVTLKKKKQVPWEYNQLHLPLLFRQRIGNGSFGVVSHVMVKAGYFEGYASDQDFAMKVMERTAANYDEWGSAEWLFKQPMDHKGIMKAIGSIKTRTQIYIFFPLARCSLSRFMSGSLEEDVIYHPQTFEGRQKALGWFADIAEALKYLHCGLQEDLRRVKMVLIHQDLKRDNILVLVEPLADQGSPKVRFQITDFGISSVKLFPRSSKRCEVVNRNLMFRSLRDMPTMPGVKGNCWNFPPEAHGDKEVDASIDVYAFGLVLAEGLAWIAGGPELLTEFEKARFDPTQQSPHLSHEIDPETNRPRLKESVRVWFETLLQRPFEPRDHRLLRHTWDLVRCGLLACVPEERPKIEDVCEILGRIYRTENFDVREALDRARSKRYNIPSILASVLPEVEKRADPANESAISLTTPVPRGGSPNTAASLRSNTTSPSSVEGQRRSSESHPASSVDHIRSPRLPRPATEVQMPKGSKFRKWTTLRRGTNFTSSSNQQHQEKSNDLHSAGSIRRSSNAPRDGLESLLDHIRRDQFEAAKDLIDRGGFTVEEINSTFEGGNTLLELALEKKNDGLLAAIIKRGAALSLKDQSTSILHAIATHNLAQSAASLLKTELFDINARNKSGRSALSVAFDQRHAAVAAVLLNHGASTDPKDGETALHRAVMCAESDAVEQILGDGASKEVIESLNAEGRTPLQKSVKAEKINNARILLEKGADANQLDKSRRTALYWATELPKSSSTQEMVTLLLKHGADPQKGKKGKNHSYYDYREAV